VLSFLCFPTVLHYSSQFIVMINYIPLLNKRPMMCLVVDGFSLYFFILFMDINKLQFCVILFLIACGIALCFPTYYFICGSVIWKILINYKCL
jgi:hypothetical protein